MGSLIHRLAKAWQKAPIFLLGLLGLVGVVTGQTEDDASLAKLRMVNASKNRAKVVFLMDGRDISFGGADPVFVGAATGHPPGKKQIVAIEGTNRTAPVTVDLIPGQVATVVAFWKKKPSPEGGAKTKEEILGLLPLPSEAGDPGKKLFRFILFGTEPEKISINGSMQTLEPEKPFVLGSADSVAIKEPGGDFVRDLSPVRSGNFVIILFRDATGKFELISFGI